MSTDAQPNLVRLQLLIEDAVDAGDARDADVPRRRLVCTLLAQSLMAELRSLYVYDDDDENP